MALVCLGSPAYEHSCGCDDGQGQYWFVSLGAPGVVKRSRLPRPYSHLIHVCDSYFMMEVPHGCIAQSCLVRIDIDTGDLKIIQPMDFGCVGDLRLTPGYAILGGSLSSTVWLLKRSTGELCRTSIQNKHSGWLANAQYHYLDELLLLLSLSHDSKNEAIEEQQQEEEEESRPPEQFTLNVYTLDSLFQSIREPEPRDVIGMFERDKWPQVLLHMSRNALPDILLERSPGAQDPAVASAEALANLRAAQVGDCHPDVVLARWIKDEEHRDDANVAQSDGTLNPRGVLFQEAVAACISQHAYDFYLTPRSPIVTRSSLWCSAGLTFNFARPLMWRRWQAQFHAAYYDVINLETHVLFDMSDRRWEDLEPGIDYDREESFSKVEFVKRPSTFSTYARIVKDAAMDDNCIIRNKNICCSVGFVISSPIVGQFVCRSLVSLPASQKVATVATDVTVAIKSLQSHCIPHSTCLYNQVAVVTDYM